MSGTERQGFATPLRALDPRHHPLRARQLSGRRLTLCESEPAGTLGNPTTSRHARGANSAKQRAGSDAARGPAGGYWPAPAGGAPPSVLGASSCARGGRRSGPVTAGIRSSDGAVERVERAALQADASPRPRMPHRAGDASDHATHRSTKRTTRPPGSGPTGVARPSARA